MSRKKIVAGNWKMNLLLNEAIELATNIVVPSNLKCEVVIAPPSIYLNDCIQIAKSNQIHVAAQNCSEHPKGAFTGEVSVPMLKAMGITYCIIGHSERRTFFGETDANVALKTIAAIENMITPIVCVGETLEERNSNQYFQVLEKQITVALFNLHADQISKVVIAYEPVWAIGTGLTASPAQAQEIHAFIRGLLTKKYSEQVAQSISILYGGSCNENNAKELFECPDIDGGLIGGASLKADSFLKIAASF
jgi:triosephosphate isomerase